MKRTPFKRKKYDWKRAPMKRKRDTPRETKGLFDDLKKEKKNLFPKKKSKTDEWSEVRAELKERFSRAGILSCELRLSRCTVASNFGFTWSFAHSLKRSQITSDPEQRAIEMREVIYACGACHWDIEKLGNKNFEMRDAVRAVIAKRVRQP